jgi:transcriptional regulator with GAF, ATPase, and Fis domain
MAASTEALDYHHITRIRDRCTEGRHALEALHCTPYGFEEIIGTSAALTRVLHEVDLVALPDSTVLMHGETGTGKELIATAIHARSARRRQPFVRVNCASTPADLFASEFFGRVKGAFTGAPRDRIGRFQLADGSTLFLDAIGDLPLDLQPKLLHGLQERAFERLGSARTLHATERKRFFHATRTARPHLPPDIPLSL